MPNNKYKDAMGRLQFRDDSEARIIQKILNDKQKVRKKSFCKSLVLSAVGVGIILFVSLIIFNSFWGTYQIFPASTSSSIWTTPYTTTLVNTSKTPTGPVETSTGPIEYVYHQGQVKFTPEFFKGNLNELEMITDAVVKATMIDTKPNPDLDDLAHIRMTTIRIDEVLRSDGDIQAGKNYVLVEFYRTQQNIDNPNRIDVFIADGSLPLQQNRQYLLFLMTSTKKYGDYMVAGAWQGKFPLTEGTISNEFKNLSSEEMEFPVEYAHFSTLWTIASEAYVKYLK